VCLRQGIHIIDHTGGKPALSLFRLLSYDAASDSSVEVRPLTGRTRQIRLHLQHMGYPILNDPLYGVGLFQGNSCGSVEEHPDQMVQSKEAPAYRKRCAECEGKMYYKPEAAGQEGMRYCTEIYLHALSYFYTPSTTDAEDAGSSSSFSSSSSLLSRGFSFTTRTPDWAQPDFDVLKALGPKVKGSATEAGTARERYVHSDYSCRRGVGRALLSALLSLCECAGYRQMLAVIDDSQNHASLALHQRKGFTHVGCMRRVGVKFGRWLEVRIMQMEMGGGGGRAEEQLPQRDPQTCPLLTEAEEGQS
jgi:hypothetical protein